MDWRKGQEIGLFSVEQIQVNGWFPGPVQLVQGLEGGGEQTPEVHLETSQWSEKIRYWKYNSWDLPPTQ